MMKSGAVYHGPLPDHAPPKGETLFDDLARWAAKHLRIPDGPRAGDPWAFTRDQALFLSWWYAFEPATGRFMYRRGVYRRMKGAGKDPMLAAVCAFELCGPCRFDPARGAIPHPAPWIQLAAVSKEQNRNTLLIFPGLFHPRAVERYGLNIMRETVRSSSNNGLLEAVTSSPAALEGGRPSIVVENETQHWLKANQGHDMAKVIARNLAKSRDGSARSLAITNAHEPGLDSVAERDWQAWQDIEAGRSKATGFLYDSVEAAPNTKLEDERSLRKGLMQARGSSDWVDIDRLVEEIYDPTMDPALSRRFYLNQVTAATTAFFDPQLWDDRRRDIELKPGDEVTLGFDGSKTDDHTALIACRVEDDALFTLAIWQPRQGEEIDRRAVDAAVYKAFDRYEVVGFFSDVHPFESYIDAWAEEFGEDLVAKAGPRNSIAWDMRSRGKEFTEGAQSFLAAFRDGKAIHDGNPVLRQHVINAQRRPNRHGVSFGKETRDSPRKVDGLAAAVLARMARQAYLTMPDKKRRKKAKSGRAMFGG
jgi:phage terminase large subunit-like protein